MTTFDLEGRGMTFLRLPDPDTHEGAYFTVAARTVVRIEGDNIEDLVLAPGEHVHLTVAPLHPVLSRLTWLHGWFPEWSRTVWRRVT